MLKVLIYAVANADWRHSLPRPANGEEAFSVFCLEPISTRNYLVYLLALGTMVVRYTDAGDMFVVCVLSQIGSGQSQSTTATL